MKATWLGVLVTLLGLICEHRAGADEPRPPAGERKLNNFVTELLAVDAIPSTGKPLGFTRRAAGWILISAQGQGAGNVNVVLDSEARAEVVIHGAINEGSPLEAVRYVAEGEHQLQVTSEGDARVEKLVVKSIPELMHCGLGFDSAIKGYGKYDLEFLQRDILPNVTTLVVPHNIGLSQEVIDSWHGAGKKFVAEVGINGQAKTADEHFAFWQSFVEKKPFLDGILINEFIVNAPSSSSGRPPSPERLKRREEEQAKHKVYEEAFRMLHASDKFRDKVLYAYVGGSGKTLNQEVIGETFVRTLIDCNARIALERYLHEMSSEQGSRDALQLFVDGMRDWEQKQPGVTPQMVIAFGLFSMPPGGINKLPKVDYHVWMDQQMNRVANDPVLSGIGGLNWWTSILADEETVRFVGKLYRHYALDGKTEMYTRDPLFMTHLQNADFEKGLEGWNLQAAEPDSIAAKSFPRYGRIEFRFMGLGRPADPEHIGDTFLWMKRSERGPNTFSQTIENTEPGRLYSLKMLTCDYQDLVDPKKKALEEANPFLGSVALDGVELDTQRSFTEAYPSGPEPPIPVWITYHWKVFRAKGRTAKLTVSDWPQDDRPVGPFGQEQTFNFLELQPYHE